jgi:type I restriction enzyme R subunit
MKYEVFLKKLYYLINDKELENKDPSKSATLSSAIFGIPSLRNLKYTTNEGLKEFYHRLDIVRQLRNEEAHGSIDVTEKEVDAAIKVVVDMYLFAVGTNITELEMAGHNADDGNEENHVVTNN